MAPSNQCHWDFAAAICVFQSLAFEFNAAHSKYRSESWRPLRLHRRSVIQDDLAADGVAGCSDGGSVDSILEHLGDGGQNICS